MNKHETSSPEGSGCPAFECPDCGSTRVQTVHEERSFAYGDTTVSATLPLRLCSNCGTKWMDAEGEEAEHNAVCRHLKLLTPAEVVQVREKYRLSRAEFSRITKLGEATLSRWEKGALIQNGANDQLLYLLMKLPENLALLQQRAKRATGAGSAQPKFRALERNKAVEERAMTFDLRGTSTVR